jgi:hypothetical protein
MKRTHIATLLELLFGFASGIVRPRLPRVPPLRLTRSADENARRIAAAQTKRSRRQLRNLAELRSRQA